MADPCPLAAFLEVPLGGVLAGAGALLAGVAVLCWLFPFRAVRVALRLLTRSLYWLRVQGRENIPRTGGAILVANAVHHLDWLLLLAASPRRVRFVLFTGIAGTPGGWLVRRLPRWCGAFTIGPEADEAALADTLRAAGEAAARGEVVCLLAHSVETDRGGQQTFAQMLARVQQHGRAPLIPVCLAQTWGSLFGFMRGRYRWKWPEDIPVGVHVTFGEPLPATTPPGEVRQAVQELSAASAIARNARRRPVHRQLVRMAARHPFRPCLVDGMSKGRLSYGKTLAAAMCLARALRPLLGEAANVAVWLPPGTGGVLSNIALALLGKTSVNLNYTSSAEGIQSALRQAGCRHVLTAHRFVHKVPLHLPAAPGAERNGAHHAVAPIYLEDLLPQIPGWRKLLAFLQVVLLPGWVLDRWLLRLGGHTTTDLATIIFSSGSTGDPKGVMLSHGNIAANVESMVQATQLRLDDRLLGVLPFFHSFGYTVTLWAPLQVGAASVYFPDPRAAREIGELCREERCTLYLSTATFLRFCLKKCEPEDFRSIRLLICGAEKLPMSLAQEFEERFGVRPLEGYGCTELSPASATNLPDVTADGIRLVVNRPGSIGPPLPGCAGRIVHPETLEPLPLGEEGLLLMTGANVMRGYLHKPELTAQVILDDWYVTGDMGKMDADGYITLTGRLARFAKIGGEMVPLERIEEELHETLRTSERVCTVTCVPDPSRGERLVVLYLLTEEVEVTTWCRQMHRRGLPNLWLPSERDFYPVTELPLLGSGKVDLRRVKETALLLARK